MCINSTTAQTQYYTSISHSIDIISSKPCTQVPQHKHSITLQLVIQLDTGSTTTQTQYYTSISDSIGILSSTPWTQIPQQQHTQYYTSIN